MLHQRPSGNLARELVHPGKDAAELLMRTNFRDDNEARDAVLFLDWCEEFNVPTEMARNILAARCSVQGMSRREYAQVATGIISPSLYGVTDDHDNGKQSGPRAKNRRAPDERSQE